MQGELKLFLKADCISFFVRKVFFPLNETFIFIQFLSQTFPIKINIAFSFILHHSTKKTNSLDGKYILFETRLIKKTNVWKSCLFYYQKYLFSSGIKLYIYIFANNCYNHIYKWNVFLYQRNVFSSCFRWKWELLSFYLLALKHILCCQHNSFYFLFQDTDECLLEDFVSDFNTFQHC